MKTLIRAIAIALLAVTPFSPHGADDDDRKGSRRVRAAQARLEPSQEVGSAWQEEEYREFDFWVGEWDVKLRTLQADNSWEDSRSARAKIYRILDGRAIVELWDEQASDDAIRGYSLRFFDPDRQKWRLFLNWPGMNRSGTDTLDGSFRHGRGEFFSTRARDGVHTISRYTFSDIAPDRLRWDDGFSTDGGRTWRGNWIMEFTRTGDRASWPAAGETAHTFHTGERCDRAEFREFERLEGMHHGEVRLFDDSGTERTSVARLVGYRVLDGCAVMTFLEYISGGRVHTAFSMQTYNTYLDLFEETSLDNQPGTRLHLLYGSMEDGAIRLRTRSGYQPARRHTWLFPDEERAVLRVEQGAGGAAWRPLAIVELKRGARSIVRPQY